MLDVQITPASRHIHIRLRGELSGATAPQLESALAELLAGGQPRWLLDLGELSFTASAGLRVFLSYAKKTKNAGGRLVLGAPQPAVREVLTTVGFDKILLLGATVDEAVRLLEAA